MMPFSTRSRYSPFCASKPNDVDSLSSSFDTTTMPSLPAFDAIVLHGTVRALAMISTPCFWSKLAVAMPSRARVE